MIRTTSLAILSFFLILMGLTHKVFAADPIYTSFFNNKALLGYDTVSYFIGDGKPVKGSAQFKTQWKGAEWFFSSQANLDKFKANPKKYAPQYGGYCAWAIGEKGSLYKGDPRYYTLENGKLYLNYSKKIHDKWLKKQDFFIKEADKRYPQLVDLK